MTPEQLVDRVQAFFDEISDDIDLDEALTALDLLRAVLLCAAYEPDAARRVARVSYNFLIDYINSPNTNPKARRP
jgi:hypothetical protein